MGEKVRAIGPYSRLCRVQKLDGRTREAALMRKVRTELTAHVGGNPNFVQRMLIERAVILSLRCAQIDDRIMSDKVILSQMDSNQGIAWQNALRRTLVALGVESAVTNPMDADTALDP